MDEQKIRKMAKRRAQFKIHAGVYLVLNIFLAVVNAVVSPNTLWFHWSAIGWGFGVAMHGFFTYYGAMESLEEKEFQALKIKYANK